MDTLGVIPSEYQKAWRPKVKSLRIGAHTTPGGTVSLSEQEQQALREIEQSLLAEDPKFGVSVREEQSFIGGNGGGRVTLRGIALVVLGLVLLIAGAALSQASLWFIILAVAGFLVMFGGGVWMLRSSPNSSTPQKKRNKNTADADESSLGSRMEDKFRRRFEQP